MIATSATIRRRKDENKCRRREWSTLRPCFEQLIAKTFNEALPAPTRQRRPAEIQISTPTAADKNGCERRNNVFDDDGLVRRGKLAHKVVGGEAAAALNVVDLRPAPG